MGCRGEGVEVCGTFDRHKKAWARTGGWRFAKIYALINQQLFDQQQHVPTPQQSSSASGSKYALFKGMVTLLVAFMK